MSKEPKYVPFKQATEAHRLHEKDAGLPNFKTLKNLYSSRDDGCPSLRSDFTYETEQIEAFGDAWGGTPSADTSDFLNALYELRGEADIYFSRLVPFSTASGTATVKISTYAEGTVATSASTATGTGTEWLANAWPGCFLEISSVMYLVTAVSSDTSITVDGTLAGSGAYTLYQTWHPTLGDHRLNIQEWGNYAVVSAVDPAPPIVKEYIAGPWYAATDQIGLWDWVSQGADFKMKVLFDGTNYVGINTTGIFSSTDPTSSWTTEVTEADHAAICSWQGTPRWVSIGDDVCQESTDAAAGTWNDRSANYPAAANGAYVYAIAGNDTNVVFADDSRDTWYSADLTGAWTTVANAFGSSADPIYVKAMDSDGTNFTAITSEGVYYTADETSTWTYKMTCVDGRVASDGTNTVIVIKYLVGAEYRYAAYTSTDGCANVTAATTQPDVTGTVISLTYNGSYFILSTVGWCGYSEDGTTWTEIETELYGQITHDGTMTTVLIWHGNATLYEGTQGTASGDATITSFRPISDQYRGTSFAAVDAYVVQVGMLEWNTDGEVWKYYPRRVRWAAPGTLDDFGGEGAGFLDCPEGGCFLDARPAGHNIVTFESQRLGLLSQIGDLDSPWGYQVLKANVSTISNPLVQGDEIYFLARGGHMWKTNGVQASQIGGFDLTEFEDWDSDGGPVWLDRFEDYGCFTVFRPQVTGSTHKVYLISEASGAITHIELPEWDDGGTAMIPKSCFVSQVPGSERLYVGYDPLAADADHCVSIYLNVNAVIKGLDTVASGETSYWHAVIETDEVRLAKEGLTSTVHEVELRTHSAGGTVEPDVTAEIKSSEETAWRCAGTTEGTIALTTTTCEGTGTVFSNIFGAGDDATKVFTTPQPAARLRVYRHTTATDTYVLQTLSTDYTISGTSEITLTDALETGKNLVGYWDSKPEVKVEVGDYIRSTSGDTMHRITAVTDYKTLTLDHDLASGTDSGTHVPAGQMDTDDSYQVLAAPAKVDAMNLKLRIIPRNDANASKRAKVYGAIISATAIESVERKND